MSTLLYRLLDGGYADFKAVALAYHSPNGGLIRCAPAVSVFLCYPGYMLLTDYFK